MLKLISLFDSAQWCARLRDHLFGNKLLICYNWNVQQCVCLLLAAVSQCLSKNVMQRKRILARKATHMIITIKDVVFYCALISGVFWSALMALFAVFSLRCCCDEPVSTICLLSYRISKRLVGCVETMQQRLDFKSCTV